MRYNYHFTQTKNLASILRWGLRPRTGIHSSVVGEKTSKLAYAAGDVAAISSFSSFEYYYGAVKDGKHDEGTERSELYRRSLTPRQYLARQQGIEEIKKTRSFAEYAKRNVYLCFDRRCISDRHEERPVDSYTTQTIPPEEIKVCVIRRKSDNSVYSYSMLDVFTFLCSQNPKHSFLGDYVYEDLIDRFSGGDFYMDRIGLEKFIEMFPEILEDQEMISCQDILSAGQTRGIKRGAIDSIKSFFQNLLHRGSRADKEGGDIADDNDR